MHQQPRYNKAQDKIVYDKGITEASRNRIILLNILAHKLKSYISPTVSKSKNRKGYSVVSLQSLAIEFLQLKKRRFDELKSGNIRLPVNDDLR